ncbi:MAG: polysaccharide biosynthesis protein [Oscillospiraceae bacterium]|nr:polysaccharide biosynthesis protein [Oscillospiraceae bacterium]
MVVFMREQTKQSFIKGATILTVVSLTVRVISTLYKLPLFNILDSPGRGAFQTTYNVFGLILALSTAGIPVALSRLVSSANAKGDTTLVRRYFSVALPAFSIVGVIAMLVMFFFAEDLAELLGGPLAAPGIMVLAPATFFSCIISVYRGYAQGHENMIPTAISQIFEVTCKVVIGIAVALWLVSLNYSSDIVSAGAITGVTVGLGLCIPLLIFYNRKINRSHPSHINTNKAEPPRRLHILKQIVKVSIPITLSASFMAAMGLVDNAIILHRLQSALGYTQIEASAAWGVYALGFSLFTIPQAIAVPISITIIPAIAAALARKQYLQANAIMQTSLKLVNLVAMPAAFILMTLSKPLLIALYDYDLQFASTMLTLLGAASFFVCLQFITSSILQANGHERVALITFPIGAAVRFVVVYVLSGNPNIAVIASPIGTLICFIIISMLNLAFIKVRVKQLTKLRSVFIKPLICSLIMGLVGFAAYTGVRQLGYGTLGTGQVATIFYLFIALIVCALVYIVFVIFTKVITKEDLAHVPKGEKIARLLRVR